MPLSASLARAALSAVREEEGEGEGPLCRESGGGRGQSGKVSLGEGRVKGPLPDGLLTLWCPASPIPAYPRWHGRSSRFPFPPQPLTLNLEPGEIRGEKTSPAGLPSSRGKRGPDFKTTGTAVETEAPVLGLRIPPRQDLVWLWREADMRGGPEGVGQEGISRIPAPPGPGSLGGSQSGLLVSVPLPHPGVWLRCGWTPEGRRPEACDCV